MATSNANSQKAHDSHDLLDFANSHGGHGNGNNYKPSQEANKKADLMSFDNLF